jgi:hypothetical protein
MVKQREARHRAASPFSNGFRDDFARNWGPAAAAAGAAADAIGTG